MMIQKYFETQEENEKVILVIRRHWMALYKPIFIAFCSIIFGFIAISYLPKFAPSLFEGTSYNFYVLILSVWFLAANLYFFVSWLVFYLNVGIVTDQNFVDIDQENLLHRKVSTLSLKDIQDVSASHKGFFQTYFDFGDVLVQTAGELPNFELINIPDPAGYAKKILDLQENFKR